MISANKFYGIQTAGKMQENMCYLNEKIMLMYSYKRKLKEGQKSCQNGTLIHCLAPNSELIFDLKKLARNLDNSTNVITIETVKHYDQIGFPTMISETKKLFSVL